MTVLVALALLGCTSRDRTSASDAGPGATSFGGSAAFEGEIETETAYSGSAVLHWRFTFKRDKMRVDPVEIGGVVIDIVDLGAQTSTKLFPDSKQYFVAPLGSLTLTRSVPVERRGKEVVLGRACEEWSATLAGAGGTVVSCFAAGSFVPAAERAWQHWAGASLAMAGGARGVPLREVIRDASGAVTSTMHAVRIEEKAISDIAFEVPAGYIRAMKVSDLAKPIPTTSAP